MHDLNGNRQQSGGELRETSIPSCCNSVKRKETTSYLLLRLVFALPVIILSCAPHSCSRRVDLRTDGRYEPVGPGCRRGVPVAETDHAARPTGPLDPTHRRAATPLGLRALQRGPLTNPALPLLATGIAALDRLLDGGLPHGAIVEMLGRPTARAGITALAATPGTRTNRHTHADQPTLPTGAGGTPDWLRIESGAVAARHRRQPVCHWHRAARG